MRLARLFPFVVLLVPVVAQPNSPSADEYFSRSQERLVSIGRPPEANPSKSCLAYVQDAFDTPSIAQAIASDRWKEMGVRHRDLLAAAIAVRLARECVSLLSRADPAQARLARMRELPGAVRLTVTYRDAEGQEGLLAWTVRPGGALGWTALDLTVDGRGMQAMFGTDFAGALIATGGDLESAVEHFARMIMR